MNIENMLDRVVVIDNREDEIEDLVAKLKDFDISVDKYVVSDDYSSLPVMTRNRQLIFIDLMLDEDEGHTATNIARVIQILKHIVGKGFGPYGLVIWSKHTDKMKDVIARLTTASTSLPATDEQHSDDEDEVSVGIYLDNPPLFIIDVDKIQFKSTGEWDFSNLMPILNQRLQESNASYFFLRWLSVTRQASQDTIASIYGLTSGYSNKEAEIGHILRRLASNQTGISHLYPGLTSDAYRAFSDILHPRINALTSMECLPDFTNVRRAFLPDQELPILARLNTILLIDDVGILQDEIIPGNIYQIMDVGNPIIVKQEDRISFSRKNENNKWEDYKDYNVIPIAIELTPPCDFSNKKVMSRIIGGYIASYSAHENKDKAIMGGYKCYVIQPIHIPGESDMKYIIFDFRYLFSPKDDELKDPTQYKVLFRANHPLFSDVLQKFSSHAARLGLNSMEPNSKLWQ